MAVINPVIRQIVLGQETVASVNIIRGHTKRLCAVIQELIEDREHAEYNVLSAAKDAPCLLRVAGLGLVHYQFVLALCYYEHLLIIPTLEHL
jgi:hypothetical protein